MTNGTVGGYKYSDLNTSKYKQRLAFAAQYSLTNWNNSRLREPVSPPFQVIDFFSGAGGMSLGFASLPKIFKIIGGCDIDADAAKTFSHNFNVPGIQADVSNLSRNKKFLIKFMSQLEYDENKPLVVVGCAPCQGFSSHRKKNWSKKDVRNNLIKDFATLAVQLKPSCIVMENVPEILSHKYWHYFEESRQIFEKHGYIVKNSIHNAASFGVPQERFRALVIAMKKDFSLPTPLIENPKNYITVRQAIETLPRIAPGIYHSKDKLHRSAKHRESTIKIIKSISKNGGSRPPGVGPECLDKVKGFADVYGRLSWDKPSITITHYARNPASGRFVHPEQNRGLTAREAASLQSFPVGFEFLGSFDSIFKQIGEAVPPKMACAIAASVSVDLSFSKWQKNNIDEDKQVINNPVSNSFSSVIAGIKSSRDKNVHVHR